jgi:Haem-NO-binding
VYGLVNKAIEDLAVTLGGERLWDRILRRAGLDSLVFVGLDDYDDEITYRLVAAASEVLAVPADEVLERFGEHWVLFSGREGYGPMMTAYGTDVAGFLANLDSLHSRVRLTMPQLRPPSFQVEQTGTNEFLVHYHSERKGLGPMVVGLLRGLGALFDQALCVEQTQRVEEGADHDVFALKVGPTGGT